MTKEIKLLFLGGIGEIGKNMTVLEYENDMVIIDAGLSFPNSDEMPGIDYVIPDYTYLIQNKEKIKGIILTHGHEDHIGALPYILKELNVPVYGSNLSIALVEHKLSEQRVENAKLMRVSANDVIKLGNLSVEFIRVTHSIAGCFALAITTPKGVVFFTGDFKIDQTPIDGKRSDLARIAELGSKGILLMLQDSTNVERDGYTMSERSVGESLDQIFSCNKTKRIIVATFASNIHRIQQIIDCALKYGRRIAFSGRSMENIARIAGNIKELNYPYASIVEIDKISTVPGDKLCIITTGTQGEPESALSRMSLNDFKKVLINSNDTIIISASSIPGNEKMIYRLINNLSKLGADVLYDSLRAVHVSGHACREELKLMLALAQPKYFIPIHGEYRHLKKHVELAEIMGVPKANTKIPELGRIYGVSKAQIVVREKVQSGSIMLDGNLQENSEVLIRDRKTIAEDGIVIVIVTLSPNDELINPPIIIMRGTTLPESVLENIKDTITSHFQTSGTSEIDITDAKAVVRRIVSKIIYNQSKRRVMVIPIVIEV
ncbi:MAG: ribonuclease J [Christensenellaceae bacterium]|nr:ribonuclease J [Christensenellaceae bacterium]